MDDRLTLPLAQWAREYQDHPLLIGLSGGVDSIVLLHALAHLRTAFPRLILSALHVNHQNHKESDHWQNFCEAFCQKLSIPLKSESLVVESPQNNLENFFRQERYTIFEKFLKPKEMLLTAHHADDQVETFFLRLLTGAGLHGLSAMHEKRVFSCGWHARPLLNVSKQAILTYASQHSLLWCEDPSNESLNFRRNQLRQQVMPALRESWPQASKTISRSIRHLGEAFSLLSEYVEKDCVDASDGEGYLLVDRLKSYSFIKQKAVLRFYFQKNGFLSPNEKKLEEMLLQLLNAKEDATLCVETSVMQVRRFQGRVYVLKPIIEGYSDFSAEWNGQAPLLLPDGRQLISDVSVPSEEMRQVRFRQGGEMILLNAHHHFLKKLFQEWGVLPWERKRVPLLFCDEKLVAVVGYVVADDVCDWGVR
jgi:tRNA(Ile)-lysidine synthase